MDNSNKTTYVMAMVIATALLGIVVVVSMQTVLPEAEPGEAIATSTPEALSGEGAALLSYLQSTSWRLAELTDEKGVVPISQPAPQISFANNQLSTTICKTIFAPYRVEEDPFELRFISMSHTQTLCAGDIMRPEDALTASLRDGLSVQRQGNSLILTGRKTDYRFVLVPSTLR